jgi:Homing endonuclease associated repeat
MARPPRPRRVRRSGGGEWSSARIAEALRAWTQELGRPPRSYDWSPAAARAGGFGLEGIQKWEREFPRWPHHALVVARHGSWRAALHAAGLPGPAPLAIERRERVQTAQRLQGQLSAQAIADLLGVGARTVRTYWRAGICSRCGGPQICPKSASCADCIPFVALRRPSEAEIVRALRRWKRETGASPRRVDWSEPGGKWEREYPAWPSAGDVRARFGSWPEALAHAGLRPHRRTWTRDAIVSALHAWAAAHGRPPEQREWQMAGTEHPPASTVANVFGSWTAALPVAELPTVWQAWSAEEILAGLRAFERAHGRPPSNQSPRHPRHALPSRDRGRPHLRNLPRRPRAARLARRLERSRRHRHPRRTQRLRARARPPADQRRMATRAPPPRSVGNHPPRRHLERRTDRLATISPARAQSAGAVAASFATLAGRSGAGVAVIG